MMTKITVSSSPTRREFLAGSLALATLGVARAGEPSHSQAPSSAENTASASVSPSSSPSAKNVIFMVSDGMSAGVLTLAEFFSNQVRNFGTQWARLMRHPASVNGLQDTASANSLVTDSAAASSAWSCGQRVNNGALNFSPAGQPLLPIGPRFQRAGKLFGLVTTTTVTHATPAGFAVSTPKRDDEEAIAALYLQSPDLCLGGGAKFFDPAVRADKRDLIAEWRARGGAVVRNRDDLSAASANPQSLPLLGIFAPEMMPFTIDRRAESALYPTLPNLAEMTKAALELLAGHPGGFLLQIEGGRVDHAAHNNDIAALLWEQLDFDDALAIAWKFAQENPDTLLIVTSDHGNSNPGLCGIGENYASSNTAFLKTLRASRSYQALLEESRSRILYRSGWSEKDFASLMARYTGIWPGPEEARALFRLLREEPSGDWNLQHNNFFGILGQVCGNHTGVGWTGNTHTADPVPITAFGPGSQNFKGFLRNDAMLAILCDLCGVPGIGA